MYDISNILQCWIVWLIKNCSTSLAYNGLINVTCVNNYLDTGRVPTNTSHMVKQNLGM